MKFRITLLLLFAFEFAFAQNKDQKWQFNAGMHGMVYRNQYIQWFPKNFMQWERVNWAWPLSEVSLSRHMFWGFSSEIYFGANQVAENPDKEVAKFFTALGLWNFKYTLANGYLLSTNSFIEPYFKTGIGFTYKNQPGNKFFVTKSFGAGLAFWLNKRKSFGIQFQEMFNINEELTLHNENFFNHSINLSYRFGKKDRDKDGIVDEKDECPDIKGLKNLNGCPDKDGDGIADQKDECPDVPGLAVFKGCPDTDEDGIPDHLDDCPTEKGPESTKGCPDKDGDGVIDLKDSCIDKPGLAEFNGCPDTDFDSIPDHLDKCPEEKGKIEFEGCPDTDNDGLPNHKDKCPMVPGPLSNEGCPIEKVSNEQLNNQIDEAIAFHAKSIFFQNGKAVILKESYARLDEIAKIITSKPGSTFYVEGHTDNVGGEKYNLELSRKRAKSVKDYLIKRSVLENQIISEGYGLKYPLFKNNSKANQAKNRRVDISIKRD